MYFSYQQKTHLCSRWNNIFYPKLSLPFFKYMKLYCGRVSNVTITACVLYAAKKDIVRFKVHESVPMCTCPIISFDKEEINFKMIVKLHLKLVGPLFETACKRVGRIWGSKVEIRPKRTKTPLCGKLAVSAIITHQFIHCCHSRKPLCYFNYCSFNLTARHRRWRIGIFYTDLTQLDLYICNYFDFFPKRDLVSTLKPLSKRTAR